MEKLNDSIYIDKKEISIAEWHEFSNLKYNGVNRPLEDVIKQKQYYYLFNIDTLEKTKSIKGNGKFQKIEIDVCQDSVANGNLKYKSERLLYFPIVGISHEQAKAYCQWRTEKFNSYFLGITNPADYVVVFSLPPVSIYKHLLSVSDSTNTKCAIFNFNCNLCQEELKEKYAFLKPGKDMVYVYGFFKDKNKLYNIKGNVAEMTKQKGIAMGGSYLHYASECSNKSFQQYSKPEPWLGFRCIATIIK